MARCLCGRLLTLVHSKACGHFRNAVGYMNLSTSTYGYEYCSEWPVTDYLRLDACTSCLQVSEQQYLSNCSSRPLPGDKALREALGADLGAQS